VSESGPINGGAKKSWRRYIIWVKALLSGLLLYWMISRAELSELSSVMQDASVPLLILSFFLFYLGYYITATRWRLLLRAQGTDLSLFYLIKSFMVAVFFNNFLPSTVGGDVIRVYDTWQAGSGKASALTAVFLDRVLGMVALVAFAVLGLACSGTFARENPFAAPAVLLLAVITFSAVALIFYAPEPLLKWLRSLLAKMPGVIQRMGQSFLDAAGMVHGRTGLLMGGIGLSFVLQANVILFHYLVGRALGLPLELIDYALIVPLSLVVMLVPITVNGIGLRESVFVVFFGFYGLDVASALAFSWIIYGQLLLQGLVGGLVYAARREPIMG
jgi:hypothetical protein